MRSAGSLETPQGTLAESFIAEAIFDQIADTVFFVKDRAGRYACVNRTLMLRCGKQSKVELVGRRPTEVFDSGLGRAYEEQDQAILKSGQQLTNKLELHLYWPRRTGWCLTTKVPLHDLTGQVIGLVGVSRDLALPGVSNNELNSLTDAINYAEAHLSDPPTVTRLAEVASMSVYQLDRRMRQIHGLTTGQWILRARIDHARRQLLETTLRIADIAAACGYRDQSTFARQFRRTTGLTPSRFRSLHDNR